MNTSKPRADRSGTALTSIDSEGVTASLDPDSVEARTGQFGFPETDVIDAVLKAHEALLQVQAEGRRDD